MAQWQYKKQVLPYDESPQVLAHELMLISKMDPHMQKWIHIYVKASIITDTDQCVFLDCNLIL